MSTPTPASAAAASPAAPAAPAVGAGSAARAERMYQRGLALAAAARQRWLRPEELYEIFLHWRALGGADPARLAAAGGGGCAQDDGCGNGTPFFCSKEPRKQPASGTLLLFDSRHRQRMREDGIEWMRRPCKTGPRSRVREDFARNAVPQTDCHVKGFYAYNSAGMRRRLYACVRVLQQDEDSPSDVEIPLGDVEIVHYLRVQPTAQRGDRSNKVKARLPSAAQQTHHHGHGQQQQSQQPREVVPPVLPTSQQQQQEQRHHHHQHQRNNVAGGGAGSSFSSASSSSVASGVAPPTSRTPELAPSTQHSQRSSMELQPRMDGFGGDEDGEEPLDDATLGVLAEVLADDTPLSPLYAAHDSEGGALATPQQHCTTIADFSPSWDLCPGGAKLLVCLSAPLPTAAMIPGREIWIGFGETVSSIAETVSPTVLRCRVAAVTTPCARPLRVWLSRHSEAQPPLALSPPSQELFEFRVDTSKVTAAHTFGGGVTAPAAPPQAFMASVVPYATLPARNGVPLAQHMGGSGINQHYQPSRRAAAPGTNHPPLSAAMQHGSDTLVSTSAVASTADATAATVPISMITTARTSTSTTDLTQSGTPAALFGSNNPSSANVAGPSGRIVQGGGTAHAPAEQGPNTAAAVSDAAAAAAAAAAVAAVAGATSGNTTASSCASSFTASADVSPTEDAEAAAATAPATAVGSAHSQAGLAKASEQPLRNSTIVGGKRARSLVGMGEDADSSGSADTDRDSEDGHPRFVPSQDPFREYKIRIVERLGEIDSTIAQGAVGPMGFPDGNAAPSSSSDSTQFAPQQQHPLHRAHEQCVQPVEQGSSAVLVAEADGEQPMVVVSQTGVTPLQQTHTHTAAGATAATAASAAASAAGGYSSSPAAATAHSTGDLRGTSGDNNNNSSSSSSGGGGGGDAAGDHADEDLGGDGALQPLLDDQALAKLDDHSLDALIEELLLRVVNQLVQLASVDQTLSDELNAPDKSGLAILHYCCLYNMRAVVAVLLLRGANVNQTTSRGQTPLHLAASVGNQAIASDLIKSGADVSLQDGQGLTAADAAQAAGYTALAVRLRALMPGESALTTGPGHSGLAMLPPGVLAQQQRLAQQQQQQQMYPGGVAHGMVAGAQHHSSFDGDGRSEPAAPPPALTNMELLQGAFSALSLHDKCALSLSLGGRLSPTVHMGATGMSTAGASAVTDSTAGPPPPPMPAVIGAAGAGSAGAGGTSFGSTGASVLGWMRSGTSPRHRPGSPPSARSDTRRWDDFSDVDDVDVSSVMTESDKESLDVAMSMMGPQELEQLEDEARVIQQNVRAWILRRNYVNLREAACVLQTAWRGRGRQQKDITKHLDVLPGPNLRRAGSFGTMRALASRSSTAATSMHIGAAGGSSSASSASAAVAAAVVAAAASSAGGGVNSTGASGGSPTTGPSVLAAALRSSSGPGTHAGVSPMSSLPSSATSSPSLGARSPGEVVAGPGGVARLLLHDSADDEDVSSRELTAAETLQAATRGMLARRRFTIIKQQTLAALVIRKNLNL